MIWDISVESDYQMSNWAINRYSFQINIIGGPKKKTKWLFSQPTIFFLHPAIQSGMSTNPSFFLKIVLPRAGFPPKRVIVTLKWAASKCSNVETAPAKATQTGTSNRRFFPLGAAPVGRYSEPAWGLRNRGDNQLDNGVFTQLTGVQMHKLISFQKQFARWV